MPRYALQIEYDGTNYKGWQRQEEGVPSVQKFIEDSIFKITGECVTVHGSGRTDAGVHATAQVAHFNVEKEILAPKFQNGISFFGQEKGVCVVEAQRVKDDFHARFSATERVYNYIICNRQSPPILWRQRCAHVKKQLNFNAMVKACEKFQGTHDFTSFRDTECQGKTPIKTLDSFELEKSGDLIIATIRARSFLHHQVRIMMGTLIRIGLGKMDRSYIDVLFDVKDRAKSGPTAPAEGLYFAGIMFPEPIFSQPYRPVMDRSGILLYAQ